MEERQRRVVGSALEEMYQCELMSAFYPAVPHMTDFVVNLLGTFTRIQRYH